MITGKARYFEVDNNEAVYVERIDGVVLGTAQLSQAVNTIREILYESTRKKTWSEGHQHELTIVKDSAKQRDAIRTPKRDAQYWLGANTVGLTLPQYGVVGRVERILPKKLWEPNYLNVTDLEVADGSIPGSPHEHTAAAVLHQALGDFWPHNTGRSFSDTKVVAFVEKGSPNAEWFRGIGFVMSDFEPVQEFEDVITTEKFEVTYSRLDVPSIGEAQAELERVYPFLA